MMKIIKWLFTWPETDLNIRSLAEHAVLFFLSSSLQRSDSLIIADDVLKWIKAVDVEYILGTKSRVWC